LIGTTCAERQRTLTKRRTIRHIKLIAFISVAQNFRQARGDRKQGERI
jgi:hypothetical protein